MMCQTVDNCHNAAQRLWKLKARMPTTVRVTNKSAKPSRMPTTCSPSAISHCNKLVSYCSPNILMPSLRLHRLQLLRLHRCPSA